MRSHIRNYALSSIIRVHHGNLLKNLSLHLVSEEDENFD